MDKYKLIKRYYNTAGDYAEPQDLEYDGDGYRAKLATGDFIWFDTTFVHLRTKFFAKIEQRGEMEAAIWSKVLDYRQLSRCCRDDI